MAWSYPRPLRSVINGHSLYRRASPIPRDPCVYGRSSKLRSLSRARRNRLGAIIFPNLLRVPCVGDKRNAVGAGDVLSHVFFRIVRRSPGISGVVIRFVGGTSGADVLVAPPNGSYCQMLGWMLESEPFFRRTSIEVDRYNECPLNWLYESSPPRPYDSYHLGQCRRGLDI